MYDYKDFKTDNFNAARPRKYDQDYKPREKRNIQPAQSTQDGVQTEQKPAENQVQPQVALPETTENKDTRSKYVEQKGINNYQNRRYNNNNNTKNNNEGGEQKGEHTQQRGDYKRNYGDRTAGYEKKRYENHGDYKKNHEGQRPKINKVHKI